MGINIGGQTINASGTGVALNTNCIFNSAGASTIIGLPGYNGAQSGGGTFYSLTTGWPTNNVQWTSGQLNSSTGVFTAAVAGYYFACYNSILNGGSNVPSGHGTYGYSGFAKNGALSYFNHWNVQGPWNNGGCFAIYYLAVGDTLALFVNRSPSPVSESQTYNAGGYPDNHHNIYVVLIG